MRYEVVALATGSYAEPSTSTQLAGLCDLSKTNADTSFAPPMGVKDEAAVMTSFTGLAKVVPSGPSSSTRLASV